MNNECSEGIEGVRERHCFHDEEDGYVCCWCGDLFIREDETTEHGEYRQSAAAQDLLVALRRVGCQDTGSCGSTEPDGLCFVCSAIKKACPP